MNKKLLFTRRFQKETYKFFENEDYIINRVGERVNYKYYSVETPENSFGYHDTILFSEGTPYTQWRYCANWILEACKNALIKKGYTF